jgi:dipeptidyl-peptidase 4
MNMKLFYKLLLLFFLVPCTQLKASEPLTLELIFKQGLFRPNIIEGLISMNDGFHYTVLENNKDIVQYDYREGTKREVLFSCNWIKTGELPVITEYSFNNNEDVLLLTGTKDRLYRYSYFADFYSYDRRSRKLLPLYEKAKQRLASISPDGVKVAFVADNNLYIKNIVTDKTTQVTFDGQWNHIINGATDWVYEEEFTLLSGIKWSPDSKKIAFYKFDESEVREYQLTFYGNLYPREYSYKFPKAGETNSMVDIYVYDLESASTKKMFTGDEIDRYIPRIKWLPNSTEVCILVLNRLQNNADYYIADTDSGSARIFHTESDEKYLLEFTDDFINFPNSKEAIILSDRDGFQHIYRYRINGELINQVTKGQWEVDEFLGFDKEEQIIYFSSTEVSPLQRQVYSVRTDGTEKRQLSYRKGMNRAVFSRSFDYFILTYSDANTPYQIGIFNKWGEFVRTLEDNKQVIKLIKEFGFTEKEFFSFQNRFGDTLFGYRILPPDFNRNREYPVFVYTYGGPESQEVTDEWKNNIAWLQLLAQNGYVIVCFDNRGTDGRGAGFKKSHYMQLGKPETEDHIDLICYLHTLKYVDKNRVGIYGWSYGGYLSLLCLTKAADYFKMGIAVAPVTNWRYYDTIYTERYMRKPQENEDGYDSNSPINFVYKLNGKLLLVHGMADDNVHLQNSAMLIKSLVDNNKQFDMQFYPDKNHSIYGGNTTYHLYNRMTNYILENL